MSNSTLYSPNCEKFSDAVIGSVCVRRPLRGVPQFSQRSTSFGFRDGADPGRESAVPRPPVPSDPLPFYGGMGSTRSSNTPPPPPMLKHRTSDDSAAEAIKKHRERRRLAQIRYRTKLNNRSVIIVKDIRLLREDIQKLHLQLQTIAPRAVERTTPWSVAVEYFRLFRYGLTSYVPLQERVCHDGNSPAELSVQRDFLRATMAPDVMLNAGYGVEALLQGWKVLSSLYRDMDMQLEHLSNGGERSVIATLHWSATITENALPSALPQLFSDSKESWQIAAALLGRRLVVKSTMRFDWDGSRNAVVRMNFTSDMVEALFRLLGDATDVSRVFGSMDPIPQ